LADNKKIPQNDSSQQKETKYFVFSSSISMVHYGDKRIKISFLLHLCLCKTYTHYQGEPENIIKGTKMLVVLLFRLNILILLRERLEKKFLALTLT
jgi:hypothetical protein